MAEPTYAPPLVRVDAPAHRAWLGARALHLPRLAMRLLVYLTSQAGQTATIDEIATTVWETTTWKGVRETISMHISNLRRALGDDAFRPQYIVTVHGVGYRFEAAMLDPASVLAGPRVDVEALAETLREGLTELRHCLDMTLLKRDQPDTRAVRGDAVETWLTTLRDAEGNPQRWGAFSMALDDYRLHADLGIPLTERLPDYEPATPEAPAGDTPAGLADALASVKGAIDG